jgi:hypothetical protein
VGKENAALVICRQVTHLDKQLGTLDPVSFHASGGAVEAMSVLLHCCTHCRLKVSARTSCQSGVSAGADEDAASPHSRVSESPVPVCEPISVW